MRKRKRPINLDKLSLTKPQKEAIAHLLTAQKNKFKKLLHEAHEKLHIISDLTSSCEVWIDAHGQYEHLNPSCEIVTGYSRGDFLRNAVNLEEIIHKDSRETFLSHRSLAYEGTAVPETVYRFIRKNGTTGWIKGAWTPVITRRGRHIGIRFSFIDISIQKEYEETVRNLYNIFKVVLAEAREKASCFLTSNGQIAGWNESAARFTGFQEKEILHTSLTDILEEVPNFKEILAEVISTQNSSPVFTLPVILKKKEGKVPVKITLAIFGSEVEEASKIACFFHD